MSPVGYDLAGKVALITGGKRIGAAVAAGLARHGVDIALAYNRSREESQRTADTIHALGRSCVLIHADLSDGGACAALVGAAASDLGRLDILINMASVYTQVPFDRLDEAQWNAVLGIDLTASYLCSRAAVPHMRTAGAGRIVNFSDWVAASGRPRYTGYVAYYVAKRAVMGLTEALALELAADQILVNAIAPGPILAPDGLGPDEYAAVEKATPVGRWGGAEEIADAVLFLVQSGFVTGETIRVDGGRHVR